MAVGQLLTIISAYALRTPFASGRLATAPVRCASTTMVGASRRRRLICEEMHAAAVRASEDVFINYQEALLDATALSNSTWLRFPFPGEDSFDGADATSSAPFGPNDLARVSLEPLLTPEECEEMIREADADYHGWRRAPASRYGTDASRAGGMLPIEDLSVTYRLVMEILMPRLAPACVAAYPGVFSPAQPSAQPSTSSWTCDDGSEREDAAGDGSSLRVVGARLVRYDAAAGHVELGMHRDGTLCTVNIALNSLSEYEGGGTLIEALLPGSCLDGDAEAAAGSEVEVGVVAKVEVASAAAGSEAEVELALTPADMVAMVKKLRAELPRGQPVGLRECKAAVQAAGGDLEAAKAALLAARGSAWEVAAEPVRSSNAPTGVPIRLKRGHALLHPGSVLHGGAPIISGVRYVLVVFLMDTQTVEYDRHYTQMAQDALAKALAMGPEGEEGEARRRLIEEATQLFADACAAGAKVDDSRGSGTAAVVEAFRALGVQLELP